jgi:cytochrome c oxidase subunit 1
VAAGRRDAGVTTTDRPPTAGLDPGRPGAGIAGWLTSTDHKRIGLLTIGTATVLLLVIGALALTMRAQLAQPQEQVLSNDTYDQFFTMHGSGMIYLVMTPYAMGLGLYLVPLQIGAPNVAAPRTTLAGYWMYVLGAVTMLSGFATSTGAADQGWYSYPPLAGTRYTPGPGVDLWIVGVSLAGLGMLLIAATVLWTALLKRGPGMTMLRMPIFSWSAVATNLMAIGAFPALLVSMGILAVGRVYPDVFTQDTWNIGYQHVFWFFGHPVVYVMFFPFVGAVAEVLATFSGRAFFGYKITVVSLLAFAALSMSVWGHHMFVTGEAENDYYSLTSILLLVPAGMEYFGLIATVTGGRLRFPTPMLFALAFLPQFLIGGLTGIMIGTPAVDYTVTDTYFIVAHWHYTLAAGSLFGFFAGFYFWFPKATGILLSERLGRTHFWLYVVGTNLTFMPMFFLGLQGMPRRIPSYLPMDGFGPLNLLATIGAGVLAVGTLVFLLEIVVSVRRRRPAPPNPWQGHTLEWATSSPPPPLNFSERYPVPPVHSYAPLLDLREEREERESA